MARGFQPALQRAEVVDLAVEDDPHAAIFVRERLRSAGNVDEWTAADAPGRRRMEERSLTLSRGGKAPVCPHRANRLPPSPPAARSGRPDRLLRHPARDGATRRSSVGASPAPRPCPRRSKLPRRCRTWKLIVLIPEKRSGKGHPSVRRGRRSSPAIEEFSSVRHPVSDKRPSCASRPHPRPRFPRATETFPTRLRRCRSRTVLYNDWNWAAVSFSRPSPGLES